MGYYIEGPVLGKAAHIKSLGGVPFNLSTSYKDIPTGMIPVIVIEGGHFDAAGIAFNEEEYQVFTDPGDQRHKQGLLLDRATVVRENPSVASKL